MNKVTALDQYHTIVHHANALLSYTRDLYARYGMLLGHHFYLFGIVLWVPVQRNRNKNWFASFPIIHFMLFFLMAVLIGSSVETEWHG